MILLDLQTILNDYYYSSASVSFIRTRLHKLALVIKCCKYFLHTNWTLIYQFHCRFIQLQLLLKYLYSQSETSHVPGQGYRTSLESVDKKGTVAEWWLVREAFGDKCAPASTCQPWIPREVAGDWTLRRNSVWFCLSYGTVSKDN